ncbi:TPA: helix-turn-helix transcriptional regulator [Legionella pneumophila]|nr:AlpA family transcriptional regulator [Legionella pneumophila]HAU1200839.1 AlpA family transcriptional regulator [Legionella pneumophila]HAU1874385.1 AlpA family transcriptional regulator [Legionella pneumophila]HBD7079384.1 AlpA family transcriptional regulator [Legionella pneumophila]HCC0692338.1 AlpA family transcriptional regulator [Legionella pneumophila]
MDYTVLRLETVKKRTGISRSNIYKLMSEDLFPKSISLGARAVGWIESEINEWIEQRIESSRKSK